MDFNLSQLVSEPTRTTSTTSSILDLVLTNVPHLISSVTHLPGLSDHSLLHFDVEIPVCKHIRNYKRADFNAINRELGHFLDEYLPEFSMRSVDANWELFKDTIERLTNVFVPLKSLRCDRESPWFNKFLKRLSNKKKHLFRSAKVLNSKVRWESYFLAAAEYKAALKNAKDTFFNHTLPAMLINNPKQFWNAINKKDTTSLLLTSPDGVSFPPNECASVLNNVCGGFF